ncbi:hypothetical protein BU26DRAFT_537334 [Trematosphaeria pertusa]|uniref:Uncharacterized protein n=1 Tax=Trematosphaeria pertusa TaxID=390896 RepID=A0A6A6IWF4_9PLEO|nr:uncharacterized protein BU26DRAFT_537334 [Trematosphaeria pertusa]KAF2254618.1 hypothetical protein BU26DRAFT_537334 [Trematosphaeria pertusa]
MASSEISAPKLFARDIAAYSDAELDRYLEENRRYVDVEDPENLPDSFIQRLRDRTRRASETAQSHAIDLGQVAARLQDVAADQEQSRRSPSTATTAPLDPEQDYLMDLRLETAFYNMLVDDGGRPSHPLSRLEDVAKDPGEYREILSFWQHGNNDEWRVFGHQLNSWHAFQSLQRFARGQRGYDYWRGVWEESRKFNNIALIRMPGERDPEEEWENVWQLYHTYDNTVNLGGALIRWERFVKRKGQTTEQQGFPEYAEALKERLARHGFTRAFKLEEDAARQDKMTTWIEHLGYQYWCYQKRHDKAWNKLVDSKVLRPGETEEVICDINTSFRDASEIERAKRAVQSAIQRQSKLSPQTLEQRLLAARSKLETVQEEYESLERRSKCITEFIQQTTHYQNAKSDAQRREALLRWMLQQVPRIESELNPPNDRSSDRRGGKNMLKRNRFDELDEEQHSQEQRRDEGMGSSIADRLAPTAVNSQKGERHYGPPSKRRRRTATLSHNAVPNSEDPNSSTGTFEISKTAPKTESRPQNVNGQALRRSSRIAERVKRLNATTTAATLAQAPTPTSSIPPKKQNGKRGRPKKASRRHTLKKG